MTPNEMEEGIATGRLSQVVITLDRENFTIDIGGKTHNYDEAKVMCILARDWFDAKIRAIQAAEMLNAPRIASGSGFRTH